MPEAEQTGQSSSQVQSQQTSATQQADGAASQAAATSSQSSATAATRPDWAPEKYWDTAKNELKGADLRKDFDTYAARIAAEDSRKLTLPPDANAYKVGTSKDFKAPEGLEFKIDEANPAWGMVRNWAHKYGVPQDGLHEIIDVFAGYQVGDQQSTKTAITAEVGKLGAAGPARIDAVKQWLTAMVGDKANPIANVIDRFPVANTIEALEILMQKFTTQGGGSYSNGHRDPGGSDGKIAGYDTMSFEQRRNAQEYAKQQQRGR